MISFVKGILSGVTEEGIVLENNGIGYEISVPLSVMNELPTIGESVTIYTYLHVREDSLKLFGFLSKDALSIFKLLITVNGIGPKGALGILSAITPDTLRFAVLSDDIKTIAKAPGIGTKTASKLILELKDKLKLTDTLEHVVGEDGQNISHATLGSEIVREACEALTALGYSGTDAMKAVRAVKNKENMKVEELLRQSLKFISQ